QLTSHFMLSLLFTVSSRTLPRPLFLHCPPSLQDLPSFPTRRSSDLVIQAAGARRLSPQTFFDSRAILSLNIGTSCRKKCRRKKQDRKSTRLNSSHVSISYAVFCLKKKRCPALAR